MKEKRRQEIFIEETCEPKYYARIPNMIDDIGLSVYAYRLYGRIKRVAGDAGACWQSVDTLSAGCSMSAGSIVKARRELEKRGLIEIEWIRNESGGRPFAKVKITNVWADNIAIYGSGDNERMAKYTHQEDTTSPGELDTTSPHELASSSGEVTTSPDELKNNLIKNNPLRKTELSVLPDDPTGLIKNPGAFFALKAFEDRHSQGQRDFSSWPEDVRPWVERFVELWQRTPPETTKKRGGDYGLWISELRALKTACSEFGIDFLNEMFADWQEQTRKLGREPFTLARPGSLVKTAQAKAGEKRIKIGKQDYNATSDLQTGRDIVRDGYYKKWLDCVNNNRPIPAYLAKQAAIYKFQEVTA